MGSEVPNYYLEQLFSLQGKTVLFTGAAGGIGAEVSIGLAKAGAHVILCDVDSGALENVKAAIEQEGGSASIQLMDVTNKQSVLKAVDAAAKENGGEIDVLVNCAGINRRQGFVDVEESTYDKIMGVNLKGVFLVSQAVAPYMKKQNGGSVINIGSHNTGPVLGGCAVYGASKSGVLSLTKSMAVEWAKYNIRANCVSPGHIQTSLTTVTWQNPGKSRYLLDRIALNRPGTPADIVGVCVLLASDASSYISGCEYRVDGGCVCGGQPWEYETDF